MCSIPGYFAWCLAFREEAVCVFRTAAFFDRGQSSSWTSLVAQTVKNLPTMQETQVRSLGQEDPLEKEMATHSSLLAWRIPMDRGVWWATGRHD